MPRVTLGNISRVFNLNRLSETDALPPLPPSSFTLVKICSAESTYFWTVSLCVPSIFLFFSAFADSYLCLTMLVKTYKRTKEQMFKWLIFAILTGLLHNHLPFICMLHEHLSSLMWLYSRMTAQILAFLYTCDLKWTSRSLKMESNCRV